MAKGYKYIGNDDFRGYLRSIAPEALAYTGNDARIDRGKNVYNLPTPLKSGAGSLTPTKANKDAAQRQVTGYYNQWLSKRGDEYNNSQIAALQRQLAYQPKLPSFDIMANYKKSRRRAEKAVNPLYKKYMDNFLDDQKTQRRIKRGQVDLSKESTAGELARTLGQGQIDRTTTAEDRRISLEDLGQSEDQMQVDTGRQFDTDRRSLAEATAAAGTIDTGVGRGTIYEAKNQRNLDEGRQVAEYQNQREAKQLFANRTFDEIARGDTNAQQIASQRDKEADFDLDSYLDELAMDKRQFKLSNEADRLADVATQSQQYAQAGTQQFLSSLAGSGWRPQDVALAYQVYG